MIVRYTPRALRNLESIHSYLSKRSPSGAANVLAAIRRSIDMIAE